MMYAVLANLMSNVGGQEHTGGPGCPLCPGSPFSPAGPGKPCLCKGIGEKKQQNKTKNLKN